MIEALLRVLEQLGKYVNTQSETKRARSILDLKKRREEELAKGQFSDDGEIERIEKEISLEEEALKNELLSKFK